MRPLGAIATRVLELTEGDKFSAHELATVIASDQALSAKMLRLSNSAYYGFPRRISTVRDAVVLLGFRAVRSATLASCVIGALPPGQALDYERFWHFSVSVGMLAEVLGRAEHVHQDEAFTAGVLHNVGRLALDQRLPQGLQLAVRLAERDGITLHDAEQQVMGFTDADLGGALALHWNFPEPLAESVARHMSDVDQLPDERSLAAFVVRARLFCRSYGLSDGAEPPRRSEPPMEWGRPPVSVAMRRAGGMDGVLERAEAFLDHTLR
jgi:HD-like signal output (HDOD) protein